MQLHLSMTVAVTNAAKVIVIIDNYQYSRSSRTYQWQLQLQLSKLMQLRISMMVAVAVINNIAQQSHLVLRAAVTAVKFDAVAAIITISELNNLCRHNSETRIR